MCCTHTMGTGKSAGRWGTRTWRAFGPPVLTPIATRSMRAGSFLPLPETVFAGAGIAAGSMARVGILETWIAPGSARATGVGEDTAGADVGVNADVGETAGGGNG